jgi:hypothetical protein
MQNQAPATFFLDIRPKHDCQAPRRPKPLIPGRIEIAASFAQTDIIRIERKTGEGAVGAITAAQAQVSCFLIFSRKYTGFLYLHVNT